MTDPTITLETPKECETIYSKIRPRMIVHSKKFIMRFSLSGIEPQDLCQQATIPVLNILKKLYNEEPMSFVGDTSELEKRARGLAYKVIRDAAVDLLRKEVRGRNPHILHRFSCQVDDTHLRSQAALNEIRELVRSLRGSERTVVELAVDIGELDVPEIARRSRLSPQQVYRLFQQIREKNAKAFGGE